MIHWFDNRRDLASFMDSLRGFAPQVEAHLLVARDFAGWCSVCNSVTDFHVDVPADGSWCNLREAIMCKCGLNGRMRMVSNAIDEVLPRDAANARFVMMERVTPLFAAMHRRYPFVEGCEFFGADAAPGSMHQVGEHSVRHENMLALSYADASFDVVFHGDVLEHVPDPVAALRECFRVLKPGGTLLFTVPFFDYEEHIVRCRIVDGELRHFHPECYHGNPVSSSGALVFTDHGWPLLQNMRDAGFEFVWAGIAYDPLQGIVSNNNPYPHGHMWPVMFKALKAAGPLETAEPVDPSHRRRLNLQSLKSIAAAIPGYARVRRVLRRLT